jgi:hypothetical protein
MTIYTLIVLLATLSISNQNGVVAQTSSFNFDTGNAATEVIVPAVVPIIYGKLSPGDAPNIFRIMTILTHGWYDCIAPYHVTAIGVSTNINRQAETERTDRNRNTCILHASYTILTWLLPRERSVWRSMMQSLSLDPDITTQDDSTAIGIGNKVGSAVVSFRDGDGMNQRGNVGCTYNCQPCSDYTGYSPKNTPYVLRDPTRWQPLISTNNYGGFTIQNPASVTWRVTTPYSYLSPDIFVVDFPNASIHTFNRQYSRQAAAVLVESAALDDVKKVTIGVFDDKVKSHELLTQFVAQSKNLNLEQFVILDFLSSVALFDAGIAIWKEKYRHDAVRPVSAIRRVFGDKLVTAWGGPGKGTVSDMKGKEWRSFSTTGPHPEFPSASAGFCSAHAQVMRRYFSDDNLNWSLTEQPGTSRFEPGVPASPVPLNFPTWTDYETRCGISRTDSGVHFPPSLPAGHSMGKQIADIAFDFVMSKVNGLA